jgi:hypothetical protein
VSQTDESKAREWYRKGAGAAEPNSLARLAELDEKAALDIKDPHERHALLLKAFSGYAAAAMHASRENWPDRAWKHWRYRRASVARVLAADGMMQPVADAFAGTLARQPTDRIGSFAGICRERLRQRSSARWRPY